jgi:cell division control protein 24
LSVNVATIAEAEPRRAELSARDLHIDDLLRSERFYVDNLERLLEIKSKIDRYGGLQNDKLSAILHLLYPLADKHRRFLLAIETVARQPRESQSWAAPFWKWSEMSSMYAKYVMNENGATEYIRRVLSDPHRYLADSLSSALRDSLQLLYLPSRRLPKYLEILRVRSPSDHPFICPILRSARMLLKPN